MKRIVFLVMGIVITLAFLMMSYSQNANIFELLYFSQGFNDQLYNLSCYPMVAVIIVSLAWGGALVYYYGINSVKFDRWYHWLGVLAVVTCVAPVLCYMLISVLLKDNGLDYGGEAAQFVMQLFAMTAVLYVVASYSVRWWSSNCRHTPFPQ
ncbi:MAG: hypothetical protein MJZ74_08175 [Muribaculaceae bacterium]|nr:hypothetical protein [Muribaculaceae bacterium]